MRKRGRLVSILRSGRNCESLLAIYLERSFGALSGPWGDAWFAPTDQEIPILDNLRPKKKTLLERPIPIFGVGSDLKQKNILAGNPVVSPFLRTGDLLVGLGQSRWRVKGIVGPLT